MSTGPGLPVVAIWYAAATVAGMSSAFVTRNECLVMGIVIPTMSTSWNASVPMSVENTWPVMAIIGMESMCASAMAVTRFVAPGPLVAIHTPT
ncbi:unannotated protein [freshwater metagenome]|uniref:Unannotated protein n=1 Tax=freshwater metagenome TaxID=449393 RepID=A0A6J6F5G7_9ZZZZ